MAAGDPSSGRVRRAHAPCWFTRFDESDPRCSRAAADGRVNHARLPEQWRARRARSGVRDIGLPAKAGVIGLTKVLAKEVATEGILVNAVAPAVIGTELLEQMEKSTVDMLIAKIPMGRVGKPEEVAALVAWLASDECSFSTGAVYDLSGGRATY